MTREEWIYAAVSPIEDDDQRKAVARQLDEKISKKIRKKDGFNVTDFEKIAKIVTLN